MRELFANMRPWQRRAREEQIRDLAAEHLVEPQDNFVPLDLLEELSELSPPKKRTVENLEANIMICLGEQIRPTRTRQTLGYLRKKREEAGEFSKFQKFEEFLKEVTGNEVLLGHGFSPTAFASMDHKAVWSDVEETVQLLQKLSSEVFLNSGTLLGVTRDKALIEHDDDVDLAFLLKAKNASMAAREWMSLRKKLNDSGLFANEDYKDTAILKLKSRGDYHVDLFPSWIEDGQVFVYPHTYGELPKNAVFPTKPCEVTGLPIPADPEAMLALNYGPGWRTPDPYFKFQWAQAKRKFEVFLNAVEQENANA